jgi:acetolactate synthase-1/3 small subunit
VKTADMTLDDHIEREMLLIKARVDPRVDCHLPDVIESAGARVLDDSPETYTIEVTGSSEQVDDFIRDVADCGTIVAVVRSGAMAVARGHNVLGGG